MNPMLNAIKNRRTSKPDEGSQSPPQSGGGGNINLKGFVEQLSPEAKEQLHSMLSQDMGSAEQITKGAPSKQEQMKIAERASEEGQVESLEGEQELGADVDSDEIAMGMLDSRFKNAAPSKPRNLHERVQTNMAKDLKTKGKI